METQAKAACPKCEHIKTKHYRRPSAADCIAITTLRFWRILYHALKKLSYGNVPSVRQFVYNIF